MKRQFEDDHLVIRNEYRHIVIRNEDGSYRVEYYHNNGYIYILEFYDKNSKLHQSEGPAYLEFDKDGRAKYYIWFNHGKQTRKERYYPNGFVEEQSFYHKGELHKDIREGPAYSEFHKNGKLHQSVWYDNGRISRNRYPARLVFDEDGKLRKEYWYLDDIACRKSERYPIHIEYNEKGEVTYEAYRIGGEYSYYKDNKPTAKRTTE